MDTYRFVPTINDGTLRNMFGFHPATDETRVLHEQTRAKFLALAQWVADTLPESVEKSESIARIREAAMYANAAIALELAPLEDQS